MALGWHENWPFHAEKQPSLTFSYRADGKCSETSRELSVIYENNVIFLDCVQSLWLVIFGN